jgi:HD-like signal output (HDOD) protein
VPPITPPPTPPAPYSPDISDAVIAARQRLQQSIADDTELPALGASVARVVQLASADGEAVRNLASFVLSDVALTQKILRVANTVVYRTYSGAPITTVSKAIFMLGFETVKATALAMLLVEGMSGKRAASVRTELAHSLCASVIGREMSKRSLFKDAEEAAVAALFKNMGRLLVAAHDHVMYGEIAALIESGSRTPSQAVMQVLGCSFEMLADAVLREWQIPDTIVKALAPLPQGVLRPARSRQEWMQQVAAFSAAAATLMPKMRHAQTLQEPGQDAASRALLARYGAALDLDGDSLQQLFEAVELETRILTDQAGLRADITNNAPPEIDLAQRHAVEDAPLQQAETGLPSELLMRIAPDGAAVQDRGKHPSGKPINARDQLMVGVQDVTEMMASGRCGANDLIMLVLETVYRSMGFRFATVCFKDTKSNQYRARVALGENHRARQDGFVFSAVPARDIFHLAMEQDADLMIADAGVAAIRDLIPAWHRALLPDARSFIVLPLVVQGKPFGFFYADRASPAPEGVPQDETALLKILKGQVLAALNTR